MSAQAGTVPRRNIQLGSLLVSRLLAECGVSLSPRAVFAHPTVSRLAAAIETVGATAKDPIWPVP